MIGKIVPAVLATTGRKFNQLLSKQLRLTSAVHIDIMDGSLTSERSISRAVLNSTQLPRAAEIHLMVAQPEGWLPAVLRTGAKRVIIQIEALSSLLPVIAAYRSHGITVCLAVLSKTPTSRLQRYIPAVRDIQVMLGPAGKYGSRLQPAMLRRIKILRRRYPRLSISADVGITDTTLVSVIQAGANRLVVGSYLARDLHSPVAYRRLQAIARRTERMVQ